ncbi:D-alanyl-D-alanine carboxypeptidase/D-alanyl-D-alanine-endopeptidase [Rhodoferax sp.]|uniref:D-alanyl-D-alanine carboxypeptidase/D-alanyl-D-alanine endopeptidase n=1 Tax=Rhodoferax sp. TaxID=50421 RepID=UPI0027634F0E|nr:D-alanyl-D-alanine carboxypeptidase/D-alanyl-D-alanine-endopeptidase [Rhodoferax sp.]
MLLTTDRQVRAARTRPDTVTDSGLRWVPALYLLLLAGCASVPGRLLPPSVQAALQQAGMTEQVLGVVAYPLAPGSQGLWVNPDEPMQPASTMKLVTTVVALERLGPNARGRTDLAATDKPQDGVIAGPLYLRGGADTDLDWGALWDMLRQLRDQGVRHIQGGLVVDRTLFNPSRLDIGTMPFDEAPEFPYNVIPDALNLNTSLLRFAFQSDARTVSVRSSPAWPGLHLDTRAVTLNDKLCTDWGGSWALPQVQQDDLGAQITFQGQFPRNCSQAPELNLLDRQWVVGAAVRQIWQQLGGHIDGADSEGPTPATATVLVHHLGRPFAEVVRGMLKRSDNPLTRLTYLRMGASAARGDEATLQAAERVVREWFVGKGITVDGLVMDNGSGLSRAERITPAQLAAVLLAAQQGPHWPELLSSLPVAGVDGTLSRRFKGSPAQGRARLKTGTLRNAVGLVGFVTDASQRQWLVVALLNHDSAADKGPPILDAIIEWVASQS